VRCAFATLCHQRYMDYGGEGGGANGGGGGREKRKTGVLHCPQCISQIDVIVIVVSITIKQSRHWLVLLYLNLQ
jgi:hypothetical protein